MKCPRCVQMIHRSAAQCPHCGFSLPDLDAEYGVTTVSMKRLSDEAGVLRMRERQKMNKWFDRFEASFPQLFLSVHFVALEEESQIRPLGVWLLNRAEFVDLEEGRSRDGGVMLVVDVNTKRVFVAHGYYLDFYLSEQDTFKVLVKAHPHLLKGDYLRALNVIIMGLGKLLRRRARQARRTPKKYQKRAGQLGFISRAESGNPSETYQQRGEAQ